MQDLTGFYVIPICWVSSMRSALSPNHLLWCPLPQEPDSSPDHISQVLLPSASRWVLLRRSAGSRVFITLSPSLLNYAPKSDWGYSLATPYKQALFLASMFLPSDSFGVARASLLKWGVWLLFLMFNCRQFLSLTSPSALCALYLDKLVRTPVCSLLSALAAYSNPARLCPCLGILTPALPLNHNQNPS